MEYIKSDVKKFPFQVVHSTNCKDLSHGSYVTEGDFIGDEQIQLKNGHLILVHFSGKFIELENDTIIDTGTLNDLLLERTTLSNKKYRPEIDFLFSDKPQGAVLDGAYGIVPLNETYQTLVVEEDHDFCLGWTLRGVKTEPLNYVVRLRNIFDQTVDELQTDSTGIIINFNKYSDNLFIIDIRDVDSTMISGEIGLRVGGTSTFLLPDLCEPQTSIEALELAYHLERKYFARNIAQRYYELANELSERQFYENQLEKYKRRNIIR